MRESKKYSASKHAIIAWMIAVCCVQPALAGTGGSYMNSKGVGVASDSVAYNGQVAKATSPYMTFPCAVVNPSENSPDITCTYTKDLPPQFPGKAFCQSRGSANYVWSVQAYVAGGATADNPDLEQKANIQATECFAVIDVDTGYEPINSQIGQLTVAGTATPGTALGLSGYYYDGPESEPSLENLQDDGELLFEYVLPGPFSFSAGDECSLLRIPILVPDPDKFFLKVDTVALSIPFEIAPQEDVVFECGVPVVYPYFDPSVEVSGGCGPFSVTYDPPAESLPIGVPTEVTVTVTDTGTPLATTTTQTFTATRNSLVFDGFYPPISSPGITYNDGDVCGPAVYSVTRGRVIPVKFRTTCSGSTYDTGIAPKFRFVKCSNLDGPSIDGQVKLVGDEWHGNIDTSVLKNNQKGDYLLIVTLQDGSQKSVTIKVN